MDKDVRLVKNLLKKWTSKLMLNKWKFKIIPLEQTDKPDINLIIEPDPTYYNANLYMFPNFKTHNKKEKEEMVVHELVHCMTSELSELLLAATRGVIVSPEQRFNAEERMTQSITRVLVKTVNNSNT
jgi:hypothetical protein